ncbi:hypothetical protein, partial [Acinetobacter nosocomialis]|uniref:hypothetical protein n=1 Tax=Acinetobacter nosocomialis TaxID=106654 RepID=UPI001C0A466D
YENDLSPNGRASSCPGLPRVSTNASASECADGRNKPGPDAGNARPEDPAMTVQSLPPEAKAIDALTLAVIQASLQQV